MKKLLLIIFFSFFLSSLFAKENPNIEFAINYINKPEPSLYQAFNSKDIINVEHSFNEYDAYLQDSFSDIPFYKILYTSTPYLWSTGNMIFLFDFNTISSVIYQTVQSKNDFNKIMDAHYDNFGEPLHHVNDGKVIKLVWEHSTGNILISHTVRPLGFSLYNMLTESPHPGFAFMSLENVSFATSVSIWRTLRENNVIDNLGLATQKNLLSNLDQLDLILSQLNLSSTNIQKIKVMLLSTSFGETNIMYLSKNDAFLINREEDEDSTDMLQ